MPSEEHDELEERAIAWLRQQGFTDILVEARIAVTGDFAGKMAPKKGNPYGTTLIPDVIGFSSTRKIIIECGQPGVLSRLSIFRNLGYEVYIQPYDEEEPFAWSEDVKLCYGCGRKFEHLGSNIKEGITNDNQP